MFKILQWNINGFYTKLPEIQLQIAQFKSIIACFQETNLNTNSEAKLNNFNDFFSNRIDCKRVSERVLE